MHINYMYIHACTCTCTYMSEYYMYMYCNYILPYGENHNDMTNVLHGYSPSLHFSFSPSLPLTVHRRMYCVYVAKEHGRIRIKMGMSLATTLVMCILGNNPLVFNHSHVRM